MTPGRDHPAKGRGVRGPRGDRRDLSGIPGTPPDLADPPPGCPFAPRCPYVFDACDRAVPALLDLAPRTACFQFEAELAK